MNSWGPWMRRVRTWLGVAMVVAAVVGVLGIAAFVLAFRTTMFPERLDALRADPMGSYSQPGLELTQSTDEDARQTWKGYFAATLTQRFAIGPDQSAEAVFERALADAIGHGWTESDRDASFGRSAFLEKERMHLTIRLADAGSRQELWVDLRW